MEMKNINESNEETQSNNDPEDQFNNNLTLVEDESKRKKHFISIVKIKKFKNKYYQRSVHSIIFIIVFVTLTLVNFYGFELFFNYLSKTRSQDNMDEFVIRPRISNENLIQINTKNVEQLFGSLKDYLRHKSPENCRSNPNYYCFLVNETQNSECSEGQKYGFKYGVPCILIDLKPVSKWLTSNKTLNSRIHLKCDGEKNVDMESIGPIQYFPRNGVPVEYFSSNGTETVSPAIFVQLTRPAGGVVFVVECHVYSESKDEMNVFDSRSFKFEIIVDM